MSRFTLGCCLVAGWTLMWGDAGVGTVLGGAAVVIALFVVFPSARSVRPRGLVRPVAAVSLAAYFVRQLIVSNLVLSRELLRRRPQLSSRIVEVPMHTTSPALLTMVANLAALTPGTMVVDADEAGPTLTVHVLMAAGTDDPGAAIAGIHELEARAMRTFGVRDETIGSST